MSQHRSVLHPAGNQVCDYLIVGAGSAGCILANRLSADPRQRILLVEAGQDYAGDELPDRVRDPGMRTAFAPEYYWPDAHVEATAGESAGSPGRAGIILIAKAVGGGSLVNGMQANRGMPRDYDEWEGFGIQGWGSRDLLRYFRRVETDLDFSGPQHGDAGPIPIQRVGDRHWSSLSLGLRAALEARGLPRIDDFNDARSADGVGPVPLNFGPDGRASVATAYLTPEVRRRSNLTILTGTLGTKVIFDRRRVVGVETTGPSGRQLFRCQNAIIASGAVHSPALLQRSGIGAGASLQQWGIEVVADRPGVGRNLMTHPLLSVNAHLREAGRRKANIRPPCLMVVRYSSGETGCPQSDMYITVWERGIGSLVKDPAARQVADVMLQLNKSFSRGFVEIDPSRSLEMPKVCVNMLSDPRDRIRMVSGFQFVIGLLRDPAVAPLVNEIFKAEFTPRTLMMLQDTRKARVLSSLAAALLGGSRTLRRRILGNSISALDGVCQDRAKADSFVFENVMAASHPMGTCRMGPATDRNSVTDSRCGVIGVSGLRVVDASLFPSPMTGGTSLPVMMAAEKAADMIIEDAGAMPRA